MSQYIIRHGRTEWNAVGRLQGRLNSPLLSAGIDTALVIAEELLAAQITAIYSSPLHRAIETAEVISSILKVNVTKDERLAECDHGLCEGLSLEESRQKFADCLAKRDIDKWNVPWPNGESYGDVFQRAKMFALDIEISRNNLIIAHETLNGCLLGAFLRWSKDRIMAYRQQNNVIAIINEKGEYYETVCDIRGG